MKEKKIIILTTHFGTNFSGGSTATCEIFSRIEEHFKEVIVVGTRLGQHPFRKLTFLRYGNWLSLIRILRRLQKETAIFYGDFYNSFTLGLLNIPFYFTYHDNWPELANTSWGNKVKSRFFCLCYRYIFSTAQKVFSVSEFKMDFIRQSAKAVELVRNGVNRHSDLRVERRENILMVGAIDGRKYDYARRLFRLLPADPGFRIDIYGNVRDRHLAERLLRFSFVRHLGFSSQIPYNAYRLLLHTSKMENLPLVVCEAIEQGIPVLAFDVGGISEVAKPPFGHLVQPYNLLKMREQLMQMMKEGPEFVYLPSPVTKDFSWEQASKKYLENMVA